MLIKRENIEYGHFIVRKAIETDCDYDRGFFSSYGSGSQTSYGVFRIDVRQTGFIDEESKPVDAHKIRLTPVGKKNYLCRDWYSSDVFGREILYVFDTYYEALNCASSLNNIHHVK